MVVCPRNREWREEFSMDHDSMKQALLQEIQKESEQLASILAEECATLLETEDPKGFEGQFTTAIKHFGAGLMGKALATIEPEVVAKLKREPHSMRDESGEPLPMECTGPLWSKGPKAVTWDTTLGPVELYRRTGSCRDCGRWVGFLDEFLEITPQLMTPALASAVALAGTCEPYAPSTTLLWETLGQEIDDNRIQATVAYVAQRAKGWVTLRGSELEEAVGLLPTGVPVTVYVGADGGRLRIIDEGWREPCEAVIWWSHPLTGKRERIALGHVTNKDAVLTALDRWITHAQRHHPMLTLVIVADGAEWIWNWAKKYKDAIKILDYYHLKEHVWETAKSLHENDEVQAKQWVKGITDRLWQGQVREVLETLKSLQYDGTAREIERKREAVRKLAVYLENHDGLIDYATHRAAHRNIGSGTVESTCKQLFNMRLKGAGMFWSLEGAQAVINLRCLHITGRWPLLWRARQRPRKVA